MTASIYGVPIRTSPYAVRTVVKRVRGGYMNRWLICVKVEEPFAYFDRALNVMICHPDILRALTKEFATRAPDPFRQFI